jgi:hypothetical protein
MAGSAVGSEQAINLTREKQQQEQEQERSPPSHRMDLDQFELMLGTSTDTPRPIEPLTEAQEGAEVETDVPRNKKEDEENISPASETTPVTLEAPLVASQAIDINEFSGALGRDIDEKTTEISPPAIAMHSDSSHGDVENIPETKAQEEEIGDSDDEELDPTKEAGDSDDEDDDSSPLPLPSVSPSLSPCLQRQPLSPSSTSLSTELVESISDSSAEPSASTAASPLSPELRIDLSPFEDSSSSFHPPSPPPPSISSSTAAPIEADFFPKPKEESPTLLQPEEEESEARVEAEEVSYL